MTGPARLLVDLVSDPVCPWCYVGLNSYGLAAKILSKDFDVLTRFRAYQLNPDTPAEGADRRAYYERKFPDPAVREAMRARLMEAARNAGFDFDPALPARLPNTLNAHRVIRWAHFEGRQVAVAAALYRGFWEEDADLGDDETLAQLAGDAGMNAREIIRRLRAGEDEEAVRREAADFAAAGVSGVPTFIVNERTGFSGALPPAELAQALQRAAA